MGGSESRTRYFGTNRARLAVNPCKYNRDQHWVTLGLRATVYKGFTLDAGVDLAIRSVGFPYGTPLPPYNMIFGMAFPMS